MNAITKTNGHLDPAIIESLVLGGDVGKLTPTQKVQYVGYRCKQLGLDPAAQPFQLLRLQGKEVLYATAAATQQLCQSRGLSVQITKREKIEDIYCVEARVTDKDGRYTENMGSVPLGGLKGEALSNALLKATTKAIRRTVLAHCGLGVMDETEAESIPGAEKVQGRGSWRHEYASMYSELHACGDEDTALAWWNTPETQDFVKRANEHHLAKGGVDYGSLLENEYLTLLPKLKKAPHNPMLEQDAGESAPDVAPEPDRSTQAPASPEDPEFSTIAVKCMEQFDLVDDADGFRAAQKFALEHQKELTAEEKKALNELSRRVGARLREAA
jgi:hypothetical protein